MIFIAQQSDINSNTERITLPLSGFYDTDFSLKASALDVDSMDMEIDLSNLGTVKTIFLALFSKLDVPIKTTISANVLEEALNGTVTVEKQCAHFFGVTINEEQAESGIVIIVTSTAQSKFKLLYFEQDANGGYGLALQEDSEKTGKVTSIGMYFLHFQVHKMDSTMNVLAMAKDPERAFFKRLEGLQPCEVSELKPGTHIFAIYGDNFFKTASYTIEVVCEKSYEDTTQKLKHSEAQILRKRNELRQFEAEYRKLTICFTQSWLMALAHYQEVTERYVKEKQSLKVEKIIYPIVCGLYMVLWGKNKEMKKIKSSWIGYKIYLKKDKRRNKKAKFSCEESSDDKEEEAATEIASKVNFADEISGINTRPSFY
ncbi:hypothetical protein Ahy_A03g015506 [Arachis hypogaea]|uniref:Uncharacterized protein n=1 Tax=Arachis hypogaea TaxID=3818 RepID=A0A445E0J9_ARAHY|nr:hypothetical protein Ahy_A03g015506 [Arachis hypogaea]